MPEVKCSVSNCHYWERGNRCSADAIMVEVDHASNQDYSTELADLDQNSQQRNYAISSRGTLCQTFRQPDRQ